jgi:putative phosphoesterase
MLIGVISDTHLDNVTQEFMSLVKNRFSDCDLFVHAGDFTDPDVYFYLQRITGGNFIAVCGNMDPPELQRLLPERIVFEKLGIKIGLIHGWGNPLDLEGRIERVFDDNDVRCIIYGHSHNGANHSVDNILFFNPGSPTDRYFAKRRSIGYVSIQEDEITGEIVLL